MVGTATGVRDCWMWEYKTEKGLAALYFFNLFSCVGSVHVFWHTYVYVEAQGRYQESSSIAIPLYLMQGGSASSSDPELTDMAGQLALGSSVSICQG